MRLKFPVVRVNADSDGPDASCWHDLVLWIRSRALVVWLEEGAADTENLDDLLEMPVSVHRNLLFLVNRDLMSMRRQIDVSRKVHRNLLVRVEIAADVSTSIATVRREDIEATIVVLFTAVELAEEDQSCDSHITQVWDTEFQSESCDVVLKVAKSKPLVVVAAVYPDDLVFDW